MSLVYVIHLTVLW